MNPQAIMGDSPSPYMLPSPPPPHSPTKSDHMPMLYYGLVVIGTAAIVLALYNFLIIKWCADNNRRTHQEATPNSRVEIATSSRSFDNANVNLISGTFKYKKGGGGATKDQANEYECPVCLSVFEEGEEVRQLPRCKHAFHAPCIDMWLYSHLDCPLCRSPVAPPAPIQPLSTRPARSYREGLPDPSLFV